MCSLQMGTEIPLNYPMALYSKSPDILFLSYMWWSKLYIATQMSSKVYKWPNLKAQFCALVRTTWTNLATSRWTSRWTGVGGSGVGGSGVGPSCPLFFFLVTLLHDHDKKQHEGVICTCIHCHCVLRSPEPPAINLHLDPDPQRAMMLNEDQDPTQNLVTKLIKFIGLLLQGMIDRWAK